MSPTHITIRTPPGVTLVVDKDARQEKGQIKLVMQTDDGHVWTSSQGQDFKDVRGTSLNFNVAPDLVLTASGLFVAGMSTFGYYADHRSDHGLMEYGWMFNSMLGLLPVLLVAMNAIPWMAGSPRSGPEYYNWSCVVAAGVWAVHMLCFVKGLLDNSLMYFALGLASVGANGNVVGQVLFMWYEAEKPDVDAVEKADAASNVKKL